MSPTDIVPGPDADEPHSSFAAEAASRPEPSGDVEGTESTSVVGASPVDTIAAEPGVATASMTRSHSAEPSAAEVVAQVVEVQAPAVLAAAIDKARSAAEEEAGQDLVGEHVGVQGEDSAAATHFFEARCAGYVGWRWAVTVAVAGPELPVTVSEVVLLPGPDALIAPEWVPWQQRVRAGDLGVGDLFPTPEDDPRLAAAYVQSDDPAVEELATELGLGRVRVLSREGRAEAADRWRDSDFGPGSDMARSAPATCGTCGFYQPVAGSLSAAFGVCANDISPADGRVVHAEYGCGAHSEVEVEVVPVVTVAELVYDDAGLDYEARPTQPTVTEPAAIDTAAIDTAAIETPAAETPAAEASTPEAPAAEPVSTGTAADAPAADEAPADAPEPATDWPTTDSVDSATGEGGLAESDPAKGAESGHGAEPAKGAESGHGVEPAKGAEPAKGVESRTGVEPATGVESGTGAEPAKGAEAATGVETGTGVELATGVEPAGERAESATPKGAADSAAGEASVGAPPAGGVPSAEPGQEPEPAAQPVTSDDELAAQEKSAASTSSGE